MDGMNEAIKAHILASLKKDYPDKEITDDWILDALLGDYKYEEVTSTHRWWNDVFRVTEIDGMLIGFDWAVTTGDDSARDKGWEFDPSSVCEVEATTETITRTIYKPKATVPA